MGSIRGTREHPKESVIFSGKHFSDFRSMTGRKIKTASIYFMHSLRKEEASAEFEPLGQLFL
jgi:hypothetical protein